jgi:septum site-determining protein MinC
MRFRGRSYMAFVLAPELPLSEWLTELDNCVRRSIGYFVGRPAVLDLSGLNLGSAEIAQLIADLNARDVRVMGVEGVSPDVLGPGLPPLLTGGRAIGVNDPREAAPARPQPAPPPRPQETALLLDRPVRSGETVEFAGGDVTIIGSIASGAEVIAGGSIHIYGALRGRAFAGAGGNSRARIFCRSMEAELLAIDGLYRAADDLDPQLHGRAVQVWLDGDVMVIQPWETA